MLTLALTLLVVRYYLTAREEFNAAAAEVRANVVSDFQAVSGAAYNAGVKARELYEAALPTAKKAFAKVSEFFGA